MMGDIFLDVITIVGLSISSWLSKVKLRRRMEQGLGRKVDDSELTSVAAWMKVPRRDMPQRRNTNL